MVNFLSGNTKLYIATALMAILASYFYLRLDATKARLEKSQNDLALALKINEDNQARLKELSQKHKAELKALNEANHAKNQIQERVSYVKEYIYKSNENNLTKLFNDVVSRLWDNANGYEDTNREGENSPRIANPNTP